MIVGENILNMPSFKASQIWLKISLKIQGIFPLKSSFVTSDIWRKKILKILRFKAFDDRWEISFKNPHIRSSDS